MAKINVINNKSGSLTIDPEVAGDSALQFDINGTNEFIIGVDDTDSDKFKISLEGTLGAANKDTFIMTADGQRTMPLQPCFLNIEGGIITNVTGDGTAYGCGEKTATTSIINQGNDMTTGGAGTPATFTAPVDGVYMLNMMIQVYALSVTEFIYYVTTTKRTYRIFNFPSTGRVASLEGINHRIIMNGNVIANMDSGETAIFNVQAWGTAKTTDIIGRSISGVLLF